MTATSAVPRVRVDQLLAAARTASGLSDFGDPWFMEPLSRLVGFVNAEAGLTRVDAPGVRVVEGYLADRLRLVEFLKKNPRALDEDVQVGGIIVELPRGGSTFLQRLLCNSPQVTSPYYWELMSPFPTAGEKAGDPTPRIQCAQRILDDMDIAWPGSAGIHPMYATAHDEESFLISRSFLSVDYIFYFHLPSYAHWVKAQDQTRFVDIRYEDLVAEPLAQYRRALTAMGLTVEPRDEEAALRGIAESRRDSHSRHSYDLREFDLTASEIAEEFKFYTQRFLTPIGDA
jgi:Sulfotransferase family